MFDGEGLVFLYLILMLLRRGRVESESESERRDLGGGEGIIGGGGMDGREGTSALGESLEVCLKFFR